MSDFVSNDGQIAHACGSVNPVMHHPVVTLEEIGSRLRGLREARALNQEDFGKLGGVTRNSQAAYEAGKRACDVDYLANLGASGIDVGFILTGQRTSTMLPADVADYAALSPRLGREQKDALLLLAGSIAGRGAVTQQPIALPPAEALERGYLGILAASRSMDEAALARELARRLPTLLDVLKGPLTIEPAGEDTAEAPPSARPEARRA